MPSLAVGGYYYIGDQPVRVLSFSSAWEANKRLVEIEYVFGGGEVAWVTESMLTLRPPSVPAMFQRNVMESVMKTAFYNTEN